MMQLDQAFQGKTCAYCRQALQSDPAFDDDLWYHRACLEEGKKAHSIGFSGGQLPLEDEGQLTP